MSIFSEVRLIQKFYRKIKKNQLYKTLLRLKKKAGETGLSVFERKKLLKNLWTMRWRWHRGMENTPQWGIEELVSKTRYYCWNYEKNIDVGRACLEGSLIKAVIKENLSVIDQFCDESVVSK